MRGEDWKEGSAAWCHRQRKTVMTKGAREMLRDKVMSCLLVTLVISLCIVEKLLQYKSGKINQVKLELTKPLLSWK